MNPDTAVGLALVVAVVIVLGMGKGGGREQLFLGVLTRVKGKRRRKKR